MSLKDRLSQLIPWNRGKQPTPVQPEPITGRSSGQPGEFDQLADRLVNELRQLEDWLSPWTRTSELLGTRWPRVDIEDDDQQVRVIAEMPGVEEKDIDLSISNRVLTIRGQKTTKHTTEQHGYHRSETYHGAFHRTVPLPPNIDEERASATCQHGELIITLPKKADTRTGRKINIRDANETTSPPAQPPGTPPTP